MTRAKRMIEEQLKLVDGILEIVDARVPISSRNPDLRGLSRKTQIIVLTKTDLADPRKTGSWVSHLESQGEQVIATDLLSGSGLTDLRKLVEHTFVDLKRPPRLLVVGIPNVGKSTLINRLTGRRGAQVGARPGITKGQQWLNAPGMLLLDSPGILWPKFEDQEVGRKLAAIASVRDEVFDQAEVAWWLLKFLQVEYGAELTARYGELDLKDPLEDIGRKRGCLLRGGIVDYNLAASVVLKDFRTGKLGRVTLDDVGEGE